MQFKALRGVCIGPGRHLPAGDVAELDTATSNFLVSIGAVEAYQSPPPAAAPASETIKPAKSAGKEK
jgi:hypothetical protein